MKKKILATAIVATLIAGIGFTSSQAADPKGKALGYWDKNAMDSALSLDVEVDPSSGKGKLIKDLRASNSKSGSGGNSGSTWVNGGYPQNAVGKIFFTQGASNYVCSGSVISDSAIGKSIILTAGHCAYDFISGFSNNFVYIPNYNANLGCSGGNNCYYISKLFIRNEFKTAGSLNTQALNNDWAFGVISDFDLNPSFALDYSQRSINTNSTSFGYPQASPYNGIKLIYCSNPITLDLKTANSTYGMNCTMTGGASGGPWLNPFGTSSPYPGTAFSLNSYKYTNDSSRMYGPIFNLRTQATYSSALSSVLAPSVVSN